MKLGALTLPNVPWHELVARWRYLDELGVDSIWVPDHLGNPYASEQPWLEAWTCLATMAQVTSRARIGALVSPITFRNPAVLARSAVTIDHASGGRAELAAGAGGSAFDHALAEVDEWEADERASRFDSFVARLVALLGDASLEPRPVRGTIPLTLGGNSDRVLRLAARYADRWNTYGGKRLSADDGLARSRERNERLDAYCQELGRELSTLRRSALIGYSFVAESPFRDAPAFADFVARWGNAGFDELIVYYPPGLGAPEGSVGDGVFERAVRELAPTLAR